MNQGERARRGAAWLRQTMRRTWTDEDLVGIDHDALTMFPEWRATARREMRRRGLNYSVRA